MSQVTSQKRYKIGSFPKTKKITFDVSSHGRFFFVTFITAIEKIK